MNKKILIIGGLGYLGSYLSDYLVKKNYLCTIYDSHFFSEPTLYKTGTEIKIIKKDSRDLTLKDLQEFDVIIQLSAISNDPFGNLTVEKIYDPTRKYNYSIAEFAKFLNKKFIFPSSCSVYGYGTNIFDEQSSLNPLTDYSKNKMQIEGDLNKISDQSFSPYALRFATVFGPSPRMRFDVVINMLCGMAFVEDHIILNSNGLAWRPHVNIEDVCRSFENAINTDVNNGLEIINVGSNTNNYRIIDVAEIISKITNKEIIINDKDKINNLSKDKKIIDGIDQRSYQVNFDKYKKVFSNDRSTFIKLKDGINKMINFFDNIGLTKKQFYEINFYRMQKLEYLVNNKIINSDLRSFDNFE